jgi:SAM-dependent methyltransferase
LYGDDFSIEQIEQWYNEEEEGYANLGNKDAKKYTYQYHAVNKLHGFSKLRSKEFKNVLGLGSAWGHEFEPIIDKIKHLTIIESSENMKSKKIGLLTPIYIKPNINGKINFANHSFDLITCFDTLHHIPNVTYVLTELLRVLEPQGFLLLREPISSLGDWRLPRIGMTKNERGIPMDMFENIFKHHNVQILYKSTFQSLFMYKIVSKFIKINYTSMFWTKCDKFISLLFQWNVSYFRKSVFKKMAPGSVFYVLQKNK